MLETSVLPVVKIWIDGRVTDLGAKKTVLPVQCLFCTKCQVADDSTYTVIIYANTYNKAYFVYFF